jgi:hypothetical protein
VAFAVEAALAFRIIARLEGLRTRTLALVLVRPALAAAVLGAAVMAAAAVTARAALPLPLRLALHIATGVAVYALVAQALAASAVRDLLDLARRLLRRG